MTKENQISTDKNKRNHRKRASVITSVKRFAGNPHGSRTLEKSLAQSESVRKHLGGTRPRIVSSDRRHRKAN